MHIKSFDQFAKSSFRIIFLGELACNDDMLPSVANGDPLHYIKRWLSTADLVVGNFKTTLAGKTSEYPQLSSSDFFADYLQGKVDLLFTANNHSNDFGTEGVERTVQQLQKRGFSVIGTSEGKKPIKILDKLLSNHEVAFTNYTQFINAEQKNQPAIYKRPDTQEASQRLINFYEQSEVEKDIDLASTRSEFIIAGVCQSNQEGLAKMFGYEASNEQRGRLLDLIDNGADVVIGSYPHNFQGAKLIDGGRIAVYSLGNCLTAMKPQEDYPYNSGCIMIMECDGFSNVNYSFLPTACIKDEANSMYHVIPLFMLDGGSFPFITEDQRIGLLQELKKIRDVLSGCLLTEARIPLQLI